MESTRFLKRFTDLVYYDKLYNSPLFLLVTILAALILSNLCLAIIFEESNVEKRYKAIFFFATTASMFSCIMFRSLRPGHVMKMIELIEGELMVGENFDVGKTNTWKKIHVNYERTKENMEKLFGKMHIIVMGIYFSQIGRNVLNELLEGKSAEDSFKDWPTPFVYWCPQGYDDLKFFLILETMQCILIYFMLIEGFCHILTTCLAIERVLTDFATIYMLIDGLVEEFPEFELGNTFEKVESIQDDNLKLKRDLAALIESHQNLNSNFKISADYTAYGTVVLTFIISSDTVISIYTMLKANNVKIMVNFAVACIFVNLIILFCYHYGQKIINQNNYLRQYLAEVPWIDKPTWFKSSLCIMMKRANFDSEIKPYGVYVLKHESFKDILKAAFSFGNIIYSVK